MSETTEQVKRETATELLIRVLSEFSQDEPKDIIVCWVTEKNRIWSTHNGVEDFKAIGMLETAKTIITDDMGDPDEDDEEE